MEYKIEWYNGIKDRCQNNASANKYQQFQRGANIDIRRQSIYKCHVEQHSDDPSRKNQ